MLWLALLLLWSAQSRATEHSTLTSLTAPAAMQQHDSSSDLTVSAALVRTLRQHIALSGYPYWQRQAQAQQLSASLSPPPELQLSAENIGGTGTSRGLQGAELTLAISQLFEAKAKRAGRQALADANQQQTMARYQLAVADAVAQTQQHLVRQLVLQERLQLLAQHHQHISQALQVAQQRAAAGAVAQSDVLRLQSRLVQNQLAQQQLQSNLQQAQAELAALWGETPQYRQVIAELRDLPELPALPELSAALQQAPQLQWWLSQLRLAQSASQLAIANADRDFTLSAGLKRNQQNQDTSVLLSISLPLYSTATAPNRAEVAQTSAQQAEVELATAQQQQQLLLAVRQRHAQLRQLRQYLHDMQSALLPLQLQMLSAVQQHYTSGLVDMNGMLSAQQELLDSQWLFLDSLGTFHSQLIELQRLTGLQLSNQAGRRWQASDNAAFVRSPL